MRLLFAVLICLVTALPRLAAVEFTSVDDGLVRINVHNANVFRIVDIFEGGSWVTKHYSTGMHVFLQVDGTDYNSNSSQFIELDSYTVTPGSGSITSTGPVTGLSGLQLTQVSSIVSGDTRVKHTITLANGGATALNNLVLLYTGDTQQAPSESAVGGWSASQGMVFLYTPDSDTESLMGMYADPATPSDAYHADGYFNGLSAAYSFNLPNTVHTAATDSWYSLQWNRATLAAGQTWTIELYEVWTPPGDVQALAPEDQVAAAGEAVTLTYQVTNLGSADRTFDLAAFSDQDWVATPSASSVLIAAGATSAVTVTATVPAGATTGESSVISLTATDQGSPTKTSTGTATVQVSNPPTLSINDVTVAEDGGSLSFTVTLSDADANTVTVDWSTGNGGTATAGSDFTASGGTGLSLSSDVTTQTLVVPITDDSEVESSETVEVVLSNAVNATIVDGTGIGTITDNDVVVTLPELALAPRDVIRYEQGSTALLMTVTANSPPETDLNLDFLLAGQAGAADVTITGAVMPAGATSVDVSLAVVDDSLSEGSEYLTVDLVAGTGYTLSASSDTVRMTIRDNDADAQPLGVSLQFPTSVVDGFGVLQVKTRQTVVLRVTGGVEPLSATIDNGQVILTPQLAAVEDYDVDGLYERAASAVIQVRDPGPATAVLRDADGTEITVSLNATSSLYHSGQTVDVPESGTRTIYGAVSLGTIEGVELFRQAMAGLDASQARAGAWDASVQAFAEFPDEPAGGLTPTHGVFLAHRSDINVHDAGLSAVAPVDIALYPGWNFIALPAVEDGGVVRTSFALSDLQLLDELGNPIVGTARDALIGTAFHLWDGSSYQLVTSFQSGQGLWVRNQTADPARMLFLRFMGLSTVTDVARTATSERVIADAGTPPAPAGSATVSSAPSTGGCGAGSYAAVLLALFFGLRLLRDER